MSLILDKIKRFIIVENNLENKYEYKNLCFEILLSRIKTLSLGIILVSFYWFYADIFLFKTINDNIFKITLNLIHIISFSLAVIFLAFYKLIKIKNFNTKTLKFIIRTFVSIFLLTGTLASINSQRLSGNIDAYIIVVLITSVTFTFDFLYILLSLLSNHILFIIGI